MVGLRIAAHMQTSEEVGGDYYDFITLPNHAGMVMAIGDATGHGLRAGFVVAMVKAYFQMMAATVEPVDLLHIISERLAELNLKQMYMGLTVFHYHEKTGRFTYASAGMPGICIYRAVTGTVERLLTPSLFLGTNLPLHLQSTHFTLNPGDVLLAKSDGLPEARNQNLEMLPDALIDQTLATAAPNGPTAIIDALKMLQHEWQGKEVPDDDTTIVVVARG